MTKRLKNIEGKIWILRQRSIKYQIHISTRTKITKRLINIKGKILGGKNKRSRGQ
jgi:hypothetical protein